MKLPVMPESDPQLAVLLYALYAALFLLAIALVALFRISGRLSRIEYTLSKMTSRTATRKEAAEEGVPDTAETSPGGAFEAFLEEDPARRELPKKEQFTAYRRWRQEKGLNWSNS